jgi:hypothetical protein
MHEVSLSDFCQACHDLGIDQVLAVGDSLSIEFMHSLQSLLGFPPKGLRATVWKEFFEPRTVWCPQQFGITFLMQLRSPFKDVLELRNDKGAFINQSSKKTAIVANLGLWMHSDEEYHQGFAAIMDWIDSLDQTKIVPFFRPALPGHYECNPAGNRMKEDVENYDWSIPVREAPYKDYHEFMITQQQLRLTSKMTKFHWDSMEGWNAWAFQQLENRAPDKIKVHWLNIFNSTVLRRDGHVGFNDCAHYYMPGPVDWWSHFFHSALLDLAAIPKKDQSTFSMTADPKTHPDTGIKRIFLLGERNSGTNYIESTLWRAFPTYGREGAKAKNVWPFVWKIPVLNFKHMWRHGPMTEAEKEELSSTTTDAVWLLAVRSPCSWADKMFRKPYHMCPPNATDCGSSYIDIGDTSVFSSRLEFMRHSWSDNIEARKHPEESYIYRNIFDLRRHKLELMRTLAELFPHRTRVVNLHRFQLNADHTIQNIVQQFNLKLSDSYLNDPEQPAGHPIQPEVCLSAEEWEFAQPHIDWDLERYFGFTPLDCHLCRGD